VRFEDCCKSSRVMTKTLRRARAGGLWEAVTLACMTKSFSGKGINAPTCRIRSVCCAFALTGHAAAPPSTVMNRRRFNDRPRRYRSGPGFFL